MRISVWSSDVCSSELRAHRLFGEIAHPAPAIRPRFAADLIEQQRDRIDHARDLELAITGIAVTGLAPGADLRAAAPAREPRGGGPTEEQRMAEQRLNFARSEEHTSELQSLMRISYAVFCLQKKKKQNKSDVNKNIACVT